MVTWKQMHSAGSNRAAMQSSRIQALGIVGSVHYAARRTAKIPSLRLDATSAVTPGVMESTSMCMDLYLYLGVSRTQTRHV